MRNEIVPRKLAGSHVLHVLPGRADLLIDAMSVPAALSAGRLPPSTNGRPPRSQKSTCAWIAADAAARRSCHADGCWVQTQDLCGSLN
jgi:hypothetical protein